MPRCFDVPYFRTRSWSILFLVSFCAAIFIVINENFLSINGDKTRLRSALTPNGQDSSFKVIRALQNQELAKEEATALEERKEPKSAVRPNDTRRLSPNKVPPVEANIVQGSRIAEVSQTVENKAEKHSVEEKNAIATKAKKAVTKAKATNANKNKTRISVATKEEDQESVSSIPVVSKNVARIGDYSKCFNFYLDHPTICGSDGGQSLPLLVIVSTAVNQVESRDAIRSTWGGYFRQKNAKVIFLLGKTEDEEMRQYIEDENKVYGDIVQAEFLDNYENLTLKSVSLMKWVSFRCPMVPFVLKTDDDVMINVDLLLEFVESCEGQSRRIYGKVAKRWKPHRNKNNKYYVSEDTFPGKHYPYFTTGPAYLFTGDSAKLLFDGSLNQPFLRLEDVLLTGIVAQNVGVERWNQPMMKNVPVKVNICTFQDMMTSHKHGPESLETLWEDVTRQDAVCNVPSSSRKKDEEKVK